MTKVKVLLSHLPLTKIWLLSRKLKPKEKISPYVKLLNHQAISCKKCQNRTIFRLNTVRTTHSSRSMTEHIQSHCGIISTRSVLAQTIMSKGDRFIHFSWHYLHYNPMTVIFLVKDITTNWKVSCPALTPTYMNRSQYFKRRKTRRLLDTTQPWRAIHHRTADVANG